MITDTWSVLALVVMVVIYTVIYHLWWTLFCEVGETTCSDTSRWRVLLWFKVPCLCIGLLPLWPCLVVAGCRPWRHRSILKKTMVLYRQGKLVKESVPGYCQTDTKSESSKGSGCNKDAVYYVPSSTNARESQHDVHIPAFGIVAKSDCICPICLKHSIPCDGNTCETTCGHVLHYNCLQTWLLSNRTCPICNKPIELEQCRLIRPDGESSGSADVSISMLNTGN